MLVAQGSNPLGNVLHVICGPVTEAFQDIHGAAVMDITPLLMNLEQERPVFLSLTRCKNEQATSKMIQGTEIPVSSSFGNNKAVSKVTATGVADPQEFNMSSGAGGKKKKTKKKTGKCSYCGVQTDLLGIPGVRICVPCAQIELGKSGRAAGDKDGPGDTGKSKD